MDGGICDSIPLKAAEEHGYTKNIVVLTRPAGYRKKASFNRWLAKVVYRKYPQFAKAIINRADMYNAELDDVAQAEQKGTALVVRPSRFVPIHHMERDLNIVREMYELGRADASASLERIKEFIR